MQLEYFENLDRVTIDSLWKQGVNMDDWDYVLITPDVNEFETLKERDEWEDKEVDVISPKSWTLSRLLTGCCSNTWYNITWNGKPAIIGVAYHA